MAVRWVQVINYGQVTQTRLVAGLSRTTIRTPPHPKLLVIGFKRRTSYAVSAWSTRDLRGSIRVCHSSTAQEAFYD